MTQTKSTRAFRTISEAGEELDLQPHVLRFWESKFPQIQPMKRSGGRRFYRPEDIEFIRGIKVLLHREKHPIKDVQKLIRIKGHQSVMELGRSVERAATPKDVKETNLVPRRIKPVINVRREPEHVPDKPVVPEVLVQEDIVRRVVPFENTPAPAAAPTPAAPAPEPVLELVSEEEISIPEPEMNSVDREKLETALDRLKSLRSRWDKYKEA